MGRRALHRPAPPPPGVSPRNYIPLSQPLNETTRPAESRQLSHPESRPPVFYLPLNLPLHLHISCPPLLPPYPQPESISHLTQLDGALSIGGALFANVYLFFSFFFCWRVAEEGGVWEARVHVSSESKSGIIATGPLIRLVGRPLANDV